MADVRIQNELHEKYRCLKKKLWFKYCLDKIFAIVCLLISGPIFLTLALLIKIDGWLRPKNRGSIFYQEPRISEGRIFYIIKFRTITTAAVRKIKENSEYQSATTCQDVTAAGRFILKWYLDEMPQLFNILKGEMSFVGPRPHIKADHDRDIALKLYHRNYIKAGLLGILQAYKRNERIQSILQRMEKNNRASGKLYAKLDRLYVEKCIGLSWIQLVGFDLFIMMKGLQVVLRGTE